MNKCKKEKRIIFLTKKKNVERAVTTIERIKHEVGLKIG